MAETCGTGPKSSSSVFTLCSTSILRAKRGMCWLPEAISRSWVWRTCEVCVTLAAAAVDHQGGLQLVSVAAAAVVAAVVSSFRRWNTEGSRGGWKQRTAWISFKQIPTEMEARSCSDISSTTITWKAWKLRRLDGDGSVVRSHCLNFPNWEPLVETVFQHLVQGLASSCYRLIFRYLTSSKTELPTSSSPPISLSAPPTVETWAENRPRGREVSGVHVDAPGRRVIIIITIIFIILPGRRVTTEESMFSPLYPVTPPTTMNAYDSNHSNQYRWWFDTKSTKIQVAWS